MIRGAPSAIERPMEGGEQPDILKHYRAGQQARLDGQLDTAAEHLFQAFELNPRNIKILFEIGLLQQQRGEWEHARHCFEQALQVQPENTQVLNALAHAHQSLNQRPTAIELWTRAVSLQPDYADAWQNLALAQEHENDLDEAIRCHQQVTTLQPDSPKAHRLLGMAQLDRGDRDAARQSFTQALNLDPTDPENIWQRFFLRALEGDFPDAWEDYECRFNLPGRTTPDPGFVSPRWTGEPQPDQTLLLHAEQGFGDTLQMIRYIPRVAERVGRIAIWIPKALERLVQSIPELDAVYTHKPDEQAFDLHLPMMSLPGVFQETLTTVPNDIGYLFAPPIPYEVPPRKIGLVWSGSGNQPLDRRSLPISALTPLLAMQEVEWHSLQLDAAELPARVRDRSAELTDFAATAAVMQELDLIITVDTSAAHLAGALGRPVWVLLNFAPDWRWGWAGDATPWYPSALLFRQNYGETWESVTGRIAGTLRSIS